MNFLKLILIYILQCIYFLINHRNILYPPLSFLLAFSNFSLYRFFNSSLLLSALKLFAFVEPGVFLSWVITRIDSCLKLECAALLAFSTHFGECASGYLFKKRMINHLNYI